MAKTSGNNLPAYSTIDNMLLLLDTLKRKKKEDEVKAIFGKGGSAYTNTKSALRTLGFIEIDSLEFTDKGRKVVYSQDEDKKNEMVKMLVAYPPYEVFLMSLLQKNNLNTTEVDEIVNFWGKANYGSTERNREDGAKLFMSILNYLELGKYVVGRGNNSTRIEWESDIKERVQRLIDLQSNNDICTSHSEQEDIEDIVSNENNLVDDTQDETSIQLTTITSGTEKMNAEKIDIVRNPHITINVDMSEWSDEKIKVFFKYVYGRFEED
ncbi:hypothetical protein P0G10_18655 [Eubacteriales bacterium DFI.9.88]|nr:hypothetical protein [Eubacteriales bacterium DFI.9.88]